MSNFTTITDAINHIADALGLTTNGALWVYENTNCPPWDDDKLPEYDFLADPKLSCIPGEYV